MARNGFICEWEDTQRSGRSSAIPNSPEVAVAIGKPKGELTKAQIAELKKALPKYEISHNATK